MVKRYLSTKFGINLLDRFGENGFYGRMTDDGRPRDDSSSAVQEHKSELIKTYASLADLNGMFCKSYNYEIHVVLVCVQMNC